SGRAACQARAQAWRSGRAQSAAAWVEKWVEQCDESASRGGAGTLRHLSGVQMSAQVVIAILLGLAAVVNDLKNREIADWIPISALAAGLGWQLGVYGWMGAAYAAGGG